MAAVDYFLKLDGIPGESADSKHKGELDIDSWSFSQSNTGTFAMGGGGGAGKVKMQDFTFTKKVDKAGPKLFQACATGEPIPNVVLTCRKAGKDQQEYLKITFGDVLISSYQITSPNEEGHIVPMETFALNFAKIEFDYKAQKSDGTLEGSVKGKYNLKTMTA